MALAAVSLSPFSALAPHDRGFVGLDERLMQASRTGVVLVRAPRALHGALLAHVARRLRAARGDELVAVVFPAEGVPVSRELGGLVGVSATAIDAFSFAEQLSEALAAKRASVVASLPASGTWDRAVITELAHLTSANLVVMVTAESLPAWDGAQTFELSSGGLDAEAKLRWLGAVAEGAREDLPSELTALETWWDNARRASSETTSLSLASEDERRLLGCLALVGRSVPTSSLEALVEHEGVGDALAGLRARGLVVSRDGQLSLSGALDTEALALASDEHVRAAAVLTGPGFDPDPWAYARAAQLYLTARRFEQADEAIDVALRGLTDAQASAEVSSRWFVAVSAVDGAAGVELRLSAARRALAAGEAAEAQRWCEAAVSLRWTGSEIALLMGRALMQLGDLVAARVSLVDARARAADDDERAIADARLAEVAYLAGDLAAAGEHARRASLASNVETRLDARNTLGKILLAEARWDAADEHFATDTLTASSAGAASAELRARLNRAIALMSKGLLDDARTILQRVLEDGARIGEDRARAHALGNLAVIAYRRHEYADALSLWEQTVRFPQALRGRIATARTVANLAELRLRLGLVEHAEQAIAFGRRLLGVGTTKARASHFAVVSARVALARGATEVARREIDAALADAEGAGDRDYLGEAYRVAARVALEDGDTLRAEAAIERAVALGSNERARADLAIVRASWMRATGQSAVDAATEALTAARTAGEEDLLGEIHALLAQLHADLGDRELARAHCARALGVRDQVAAALTPDIRVAFLAKPDMVALSRLHASLVAIADAEAEDEAPRTQRVVRDTDRPARELVGDDPQIRNLLVAVRKVARSNSTVLVRGESGTGKELIAEALHRASERAAGPLVSVNCAALVETLLLSELFGHEKGAFTGASARRRGRFEMAEGGTLFLDEIGDISPRTQVALLRVLQERTFERVGGATSIRANVRVICATHRDLKAMVERGEFREDLYYRLRGITLEVPSLRARLGDLPKIAEHLLARIADERAEQPKVLTTDAVELLQRHRWPGNVRELENVLRAASLFADGQGITASDLIDNVDDLRTLAQAGPTSQPPHSLRASLAPAPLPQFAAATLPSLPDDEDEGSAELPDSEANATAVAYAQVRQGALSLSDMKRQIERDCIARALAETKGNITRAATLLGMKRPRLSQLVKQYGLSSASSEGSQ